MNDKRHGWGTTYDRNGNKLYEGDWRCGRNDSEEIIVINKPTTIHMMAVICSNWSNWLSLRATPIAESMFPNIFAKVLFIFFHLVIAWSNKEHSKFFSPVLN